MVGDIFLFIVILILWHLFCLILILAHAEKPGRHFFTVVHFTTADSLCDVFGSTTKKDADNRHQVNVQYVTDTMFLHWITYSDIVFPCCV